MNIKFLAIQRVFALAAITFTAPFALAINDNDAPDFSEIVEMANEAAAAQAASDTYFQILEKDFKAAKAIPTFEDFDRPGFDRLKICVEVAETAPNDDQLVQLMHLTMIKSGAGPRLPEIREEKIVYNSYSEPGFSDARSVKTEITKKELVSTRTSGADYSQTVRVHKNDPFLVFERVEKYIQHDEENGDTETLNRYLGYCYPIDQDPNTLIKK